MAFAFLAIEIWILKYTYGKWWLFVAVEVVLTFGFILIVQPWLSNLGIWVRINVTNFLAYLPAIPQFIAIYLYQMWQEGDLSLAKVFSPAVGPLANKPFRDDKTDD